MRRAGRCVRVVPGVHRHPQGRHRAHPQGPRAGRHRGGRRRRSDRDLGRPLSHHYRLCVPEAAPGDLLDAARRGDRAALARLLSLIERGGDGARRVGRATHGLGLDAYTIGITGPPGAGKSTLTSALVDVVRRRNRDRVAVLAIDPSSPFSGGAILGDRVRMGDHALDEGVFIRSMATRGHLGGLAVGGAEAGRGLTGAGYPLVVLETVGVGQAEVEVVGQADTTVVVVNPGWGDAVQANKAGLMEIADLFVVNKADRPGAGDAARDLERVLDMAGPGGGGGRPGADGWRPPVVCTTATTGEGIDAVWRGGGGPPAAPGGAGWAGARP